VSLHSLPIFVRLQGRAVVLVGVGEAAEAKRRLLERAGAAVVGEHDLPLAPGEQGTCLPSSFLAIVVDDEPAVARLKARGFLVNAVDRPDLCDFTLPAIVDRDPVIVAIGTGGASAGLAAALRQRLEALLPTKLGQLAKALYDQREAIRQAYPDQTRRRRAIAQALQPGGTIDPLSSDPDVAFWLMDDRGDEPKAREGTDIAYVKLASPDPDDLTLRQARLLANADRVTHRADVPAAILNRARADADRIVCPEPPVDLVGLTVDLRMA
jgi:uroporphyrin-III C-methyltransferase/precorrin-2 dehydrogenase/sirohydrochlorin ferrochelatase